MVTFSGGGSAANFLTRRRPGATGTVGGTVGQSNANGEVRATRPVAHTTEVYGKGMQQPGQQPAEQAPTQQGGVGNPVDLYNTATAQGAMGAGFLANGSPTDFGFKQTYDTAMKNSRDLLDQNAGYGTKIEGYLGGALDPRNGANIQGILDSNAANRISDVESLYNAGGQKMNDFQKSQAAARNSAYQGGLFGSKEKASAEAQLGANLFRDRAGQIQSANELSRGETMGQLDKSRAANLSAADLYGNLRGQNLSASGNFLNSANSASTAGSNSDLGFREMGGNILNQGIGNQQYASKYNTDLNQQQYQNEFNRWEAENKANQQRLENKVGKNARRQARKDAEAARKEAEAAKGNWFSKIADPFDVMPY